MPHHLLRIDLTHCNNHATNPTKGKAIIANWKFALFIHRRIPSCCPTGAITNNAPFFFSLVFPHFTLVPFPYRPRPCSARAAVQCKRMNDDAVVVVVVIGRHWKFTWTEYRTPCLCPVQATTKGRWTDTPEVHHQSVGSRKARTFSRRGAALCPPSTSVCHFPSLISAWSSSSPSRLFGGGAHKKVTIRLSWTSTECYGMHDGRTD